MWPCFSKPAYVVILDRYKCAPIHYPNFACRYSVWSDSDSRPVEARGQWDSDSSASDGDQGVHVDWR